MSAAQQQSGEVTGIPSAVNYLQKVAGVHQSHGADGELLTAAMATMKIGEGDIGLVRAAAQQSIAAGDLYRLAAKSIDDHNAAVRQGYNSAPDAADKHAQTAE